MTSHLSHSFHKLERQRRNLLAGVSTWSEARLRFRPDPSTWSMLDMLDHLLKVELEILKAINASLPDGVPVTLKDRFGALMVAGVMLSPMRIKVPGAASEVLPAATSSLAEIAQKWGSSRLELLQLLNSLSSSQLRLGLFRHPVAGWMTIAQTMNFFSVHLTHHRHQFARLKQATRTLGI